VANRGAHAGVAPALTVPTLLQLEARFHASLDVDVLLDLVVDEAVSVVRATSGVAGLSTPTGMVARSYHDAARRVPYERVWSGTQGLAGWVHTHRTPYVTNDAASDSHLSPDLRDTFGVTSALATPIVSARGDLLGFVEVHNKQDEGGFTATDTESLTALSQTAASALETALAYRLLREAETAFEDTERRREEFFATLAHELRNPLAPLRHALDMLRRMDDDAQVRRHAEAIMDRQLVQLVRIVDDLLDLSRVTRGEVALECVPMDLQAAVANALDANQPLVRRLGHRVVISLPGEPVRLNGDLTRLSQVFANIINNAAKYTPAGGTIDVTVASERGHGIVRVKDTGVGIPPRVLPRVFDMFARVQGEPGRAQSGLGVGLSLARRFVEMHGGTVRARSKGRGHGTEIIVRLPLARSEAAAAPESVPVAATPGASKRVLVVDDSTDSAESLAALLSLQHHDVRTASNGPSALETAEEFRPDAIVLDIGLPGMSGHDVARVIRSRAWGRSVLLVAATGWGQEADRAAARDAGFDVHLTKPVDIDELSALLAK